MLRFFQSHDHTVYSKRGALWADLVWKSALLHKCEILEDLHQRLVLEVERGQVGDHLSIYVITWNNVAFHHSRAVTDWFDTHPRMMFIFLAPYSTFLNPIEEFFSTWRWKVFDQMSLLDAMDAACQDITAEHCRSG